MKPTQFTLADIRSIDNEQDLGRATGYYAATRHRITIGEDAAMRSTLRDQAKKLNITLERLNWLAMENFQAACDALKGEAK